MRRTRFDIPNPRPPEELVAAFGGARIMKDLTGKLEIIGRTEQERTQAHNWMKQFLTRDPLTVKRIG